MSRKAVGLLALGAALALSKLDPAAARTTPEDVDRATAVAGDVEVVARTIWGEARGEGYDGMAAVASVIRNRVDSPVTWWGTDWKSVCLRDGQFSCWNPGDPNYPLLLAVTSADGRFAIALDIARRAVNGTLPDTTGGATHYHASNITAWWASSMTFLRRIGAHLFYREG